MLWDGDQSLSVLQELTRAISARFRWAMGRSLQLGITCIVCLILIRRSRLSWRDLEGQRCFAVGGGEGGGLRRACGLGFLMGLGFEVWGMCFEYSG